MLITGHPEHPEAFTLASSVNYGRGAPAPTLGRLRAKPMGPHALGIRPPEVALYASLHDVDAAVPRHILFADPRVGRPPEGAVPLWPLPFAECREDAGSAAAPLGGGAS
jgi:hypothetical protein